MQYLLIQKGGYTFSGVTAFLYYGFSWGVES